MKPRSVPNQPRSERLNLLITKADRERLNLIALREDREPGYVAAFLVRWGLDQLEMLHCSLREMGRIQLREDLDRKAGMRLELLRDAQAHIYEKRGATAKEKNRA